MIKIIKGKLALIRKNYYKNNLDAYIAYLEDNRRNYSIKTFNAIRDYNTVRINLRNSIKNLEDEVIADDNLITANILKSAKNRLKIMDEGYNSFVNKHRNNIITFDIKIKEAKARLQIMNANKAMGLYCNAESDSFDNDFIEMENLFNEIDVDLEASIISKESLFNK